MAQGVLALNFSAPGETKTSQAKGEQGKGSGCRGGRRLLLKRHEGDDFTLRRYETRRHSELTYASVVRAS